MSTQKKQLSPKERQKRLQEKHYAKRVAKLRQQAKQAAQHSCGVPSTTGLLAYPPLPNQANPQQQGEMLPQGNKSNDGIPKKCPRDVERRVGLEVDGPDLVNFRSACREGDLSTIKSIVSSQSLSPLDLRKGLDDALKNGKVGVSRFLLQSGAPIKPATPAAVLRAPADKQVALFQVLIEHGWTVNTPESLLPEIFWSNNEPLFDWFLEQDADPNVAGPQYDQEQTLRLAASQGTVQVVQKLLNAGANMASSGLYWAAGAYPEGSVPNIRRVEPSADFDKSRIPVMELLLENGGDVNHRLETHHMEELYPIVNAVKAGAVERVKWLLRKGADPDLKGSWGSARDYAKLHSSDEMKQVLGVEQ
ncbi:hypothetical protein BFJ63_vAg18866 [Fusarium oxysporum f. sp. narcissi]|uniref:Uncharacterized protein n=1 Tax=Fusarium oxysporum f. sp. narcissi TaxID=451672 RepID=A0A4Q2UX84_FUSOX|nr:hypothetical protein BFJ63_vAg18866 [Fusarium oxysporum f. sp. narcissi]